MENIKTYNEKSADQEMREEINKFIDFLDKISNEIVNVRSDIGVEKLFLNMQKIFTEERVTQIMGYLQDIENKAEHLGNNDIPKIFSPLKLSFQEFQLSFKNNLSDTYKTIMGSRLYNAIFNLTAARKFFSEK